MTDADRTADRRTAVLIVGGGVSGLTASLLLSELGVEHVLIERHDQTAQLPKAHIINQRSMEIFRELGLDEEIYSAGAPPENMTTVAWMTSLTGPTALHGQRIARVDAWCGGTQYAAASSCRATNLPQLRLEPILRRAAEAQAPGAVLFGHELAGFEQGGDGVRAQILDRRTNTTTTLDATYLIAADGGRTVGPAAGIELHGERDLLDMVSTHFSADLSAYWHDESVVISFQTNPDGEGSLGSGVLLPMGPEVWGAKSPEWQYHSALHTGDPDQFDSGLMIQRMRDMLGLPGLQPEIHSVSRWRFEGIVADRYRAGRVFVVGDSAHRHPPNGGLGLNTAVADVHNLAWKLAAVLAGRAGPELLDSYQAERRPVGEAVVARALQNWRAHIGIDQALGLAGPTTAEQGWSALAELFTDSPQGRARRAGVDHAVSVASGEFTGQDVELGYHYDTCAGPTAPHAWLSGPDGAMVSTLDLAGAGRFAVLTGPQDAQIWSSAAAAAAQRLGLGDTGVAVQSIGPRGSQAQWTDESGSWALRCGISSTGAVLLRPDRHVAWVCPSAPAEEQDLLRELTRALSTVLVRTTEGSP